MSPSILKALSADAEVAGKEELASQYLARRGSRCCAASTSPWDSAWYSRTPHGASACPILLEAFPSKGGQVDALLSGLVAVELP